MRMISDLPKPFLKDKPEDLRAVEVIRQMPIGYILGSIREMANNGDPVALEIINDIATKKVNLAEIKERFLTYIVEQVKEARENIIFPEVAFK